MQFARKPKTKAGFKIIPGALIPAFFTLLTGCAALPDLAPYRDATLQLRSTVLVGGSAVQSGLDAAAGSYEAGDPAAKRIRESSQKFATEWRARIAAADSLVEYADALNDIARSATEGAGAARSLADSLGKLASGAGIAPPPAGTVAAAADAAAFVYAHIAAVRAAQSLDEALQSAQPAVDRVAALLTGDLQASLNLLRASHRLQRDALVLKYNEEMGFLKALTRERKEIYGRSSLRPEDEQRLKKLSEMHEATREWREPMEKALAEMESTLKIRVELIKSTQTAVAEWAAAHRNIAAAVREKRSVNVEALVQATLEARELVRRLKEL
ncbi:MAG: hypothetical protein C3F18_12240 [Nitrosomonadales bacterium]|nr:MAG: hypothetical protein C3F18_12240 [Nitrosomonadales bacterium]